MRSVSDNGATAPISALTYAFIFVEDQGHQTDDFMAKIIDRHSSALSEIKDRTAPESDLVYPGKQPADRCLALTEHSGEAKRRAHRDGRRGQMHTSPVEQPQYRSDSRRSRSSMANPCLSGLRYATDPSLMTLTEVQR